MKRLVVIVTMLVALDAFAAGEMRKLDFLTGEWKGEAWVRMGPSEPEHVLQTEIVRSKAGGKVLVIEGTGRRKLPNGTGGDVVHDAFAVVTWDDVAKKYVFQTWLADDKPSVPMSFDVPSDNHVIWGFDTPQGGKVRYTIRLNDEGKWHEVGEFSRDGRTFMKFFEMTLTKQ